MSIIVEVHPAEPLKYRKSVILTLAVDDKAYLLYIVLSRRLYTPYRYSFCDMQRSGRCTRGADSVSLGLLRL